MRLLHVGSGFRPWRRGGLVAYTEDLMAEQVRRDHEVSYFFSGRHYPVARAPRLRRQAHAGLTRLELLNSPLYDHGRQPRLELDEPVAERLFEQTLRELRPDVVHVHELAGLPSSLLDIARAAGVPTIVTLQDYFPLCSTFKLLDADGRVCLRREIGADCVRTTARDPREPGLLIEATLVYQVLRLPILRDRYTPRRERWLKRALAPIVRAEVARRARATAEHMDAAAFQRRRDVNVERLNRADCVIAMSNRVAEIYARLGVDPARLRTVHLTLAHIERLRPREARAEAPLTFATLAGFESVPKGARVLLDAMRILSRRVPAGRLRLLVFGWVDDRLAAEANALPGVEFRGGYPPERLDAILDEVDVGVVPSVWEEAYGYAGVEFLAKGIPVIANAIGGMVDYTREGETGWLNRSCSGEELARIMGTLADDPRQVADLNAKLRAERDTIVKPMARHAGEMDEIYGELRR